MKIFIGSSSEAVSVANEISSILNELGAESGNWNSAAVFTPSKFSLESLESAINNYDAAIFVFAPDDVIISRGEVFSIPRDNVIFEMGLFMGKMGHNNVAVVNTQNELKVMSDFFGFTPIHVDNLINDIKMWLDNLKPSSSIDLLPRKEIDNSISLEERWKYAKVITIVNFAATSFTLSSSFASESVYPSAIKELMKRKINEGVEFRFLITNPGSYADYDASKYKMRVIANSQYSAEDVIKMSLKQLSMDKRTYGRIQYRLSNVVLPYAAMLVENDKEHLLQNSIKIDLYSPFLSHDNQRRSFVIYPSNKNYDFFFNNITDMWVNGMRKKTERSFYLSSTKKSGDSFADDNSNYQLISYSSDKEIKGLYENYSSTFVYLIEGEAEIRISNKKIVLSPQDVFIIPRQKKYSVKIKKGSKLIKTTTYYRNEQ